MERLFTAAVERALAQAATWSRSATSSELEAPALLLGLLAESECRAALILTERGIDAAAVRHHWPTLAHHPARFPCWDGAIPSSGATGAPDTPANETNSAKAGTPVTRFSREVEGSLAAAAIHLIGEPRPLTLATEHILLGLAAANHDVADWLRQQGIDPDRLACELQPTGPTVDADAPADSRPLEWPCEPPLEETTGCTPAPSCARQVAKPEPRSAVEKGKTAERVHVLRILDAAANRAREGLRVAEDYVRFVLDDRHLTEQFKRLRHDLVAALSGIPRAERLAARDTLADVGTTVATATEFCRLSSRDVLAANLTRLQEALRSLEEFAKTLDPQVAASVEQLRYRSYTLQRAAEITGASLERLGEARLYVLLDGRSTVEEFAATARALIEAQVHVIQLRDKRLDDRRLLERARLLRQMTRPAGPIFIVNDRPDVAVLAEADGVHVGQEELTVKDARAVVGPQALVGVSTHSIEQARQAVLDGADYLGVGPTFPSGTKAFARFPGIDLVRAVAAEIRLPAFAIGGISLSNVGQVLAGGLSRVAIGGAVGAAADPGDAARKLLAALAGG